VSATREGITYVLPLRWSEDQGIVELAAYLERIAEVVDEVVVVDGSPRQRFDLHAHLLAGVRHIRPDPSLDFAMGKVNGVVTGVRAARNERVILADDDVRYRPEQLGQLAALLDRAELVRPQNYFSPLPWHARLDTGRSLLNRVASGDPTWPAADFPGTLALGQSFFCEIGAYDGDVMFENLELIRTVHAAGGRVLSRLDLYVERRPPSASHFLSQRVRQAYDDFALPLRMAVLLMAGPLLVAAAMRRRFGAIALSAAGIAGVAEAGRRRAGGRAYFPASSSALAPLWVLERAVCAWLAVVKRLRGGVGYSGRTIKGSATPLRELRRRYAASRPAAGSDERADGQPFPSAAPAASKRIVL
jgi:hypothetical protein